MAVQFVWTVSRKVTRLLDPRGKFGGREEEEEEEGVEGESVEGGESVAAGAAASLGVVVETEL